MTKQSLNKHLFLALILSLFSVNTYAGVIYNEPFTGQESPVQGIDGGTLNDFSNVTWSVDTSNADLQNSSDYVKVITRQGTQILAARDVKGSTGNVNGSATWMSPLIDITGLSNISFSIDVFHIRGVTVSDPSDFVKISYILDDGILPITVDVQTLSGAFADTNVNDNIGSGLMLRILAEFANGPENGEQYAIDNVIVNARSGSAPEPVTLALLGIGLAGVCYRRKNVKQ